MGLFRLKSVFLVNLVTGCLAYSLLMINQLVNRMDGLWHGSISFGGNHERSLGRWLWPYFDKVRLYLSPDPLTSVLALSFFIASIILILDIFAVEHRLWQYLISLLFTINISVLVALSYRFQSPVFGASCFLAVLGVYIMIKAGSRIMLFLAAPLCITAMLGLYQANIGCSCLIILTYLMLMLYRGQKTAKELLQFATRCILSLFIGGLLYAGITKLILWIYDLKMSSYGGAEQIGVSGVVKNISNSIHNVYFHFFEYYLNNSIKTNIFGKKAYFLIYVMIFAGLVYMMAEILKRKRINAVLFLALMILVPVACNVVLLIAFDYSMSIQMTIPVSMVIPVLLCLLSNAAMPEVLPVRIYRTVFCLGACFLLYGNFGMILYDQYVMYSSMNSTKELASEIITSLQINDLYHPYYKYVFLGSPYENPLFMNNLYLTERTNSYAHIGGWTSENFGTSSESWRGLLNNDMGLNIYVAEEDKYETAWDNPVVKGMPVFPEKGSCALVGDVVVVKIASIDNDEIGE